jgi:hypothetical protein
MLFVSNVGIIDAFDYVNINAGDKALIKFVTYQISVLPYSLYFPEILYSISKKVY